MQGHAIGYRAHGVLPDAEVQVVAAILAESVMSLVFEQRLGGGRQVRRAAGEGVYPFGQGVHHLAGSVPGGDGLVFSLEKLIQAPIPPLGQVSPPGLFQLGSFDRVGLAVRFHPDLPFSLPGFSPFQRLSEVVTGLLGNRWARRCPPCWGCRSR